MKSPSLKVIDFDSVVKNTKVAKSIIFDEETSNRLFVHSSEVMELGRDLRFSHVLLKEIFFCMFMGKKKHLSYIKEIYHQNILIMIHKLKKYRVIL